MTQYQGTWLFCLSMSYWRSTATSTYDYTAGYSTTCVAHSGSVKCWGSNDYGELGLGHKDMVTQPLDTAIDLGSDFYAETVDCGRYQCCSVSAVSTAKCWGQQHSYGLGYEDTNSRGDAANEMGDYLPLVDVGSSFAIIDISVGNNHVCVLSSGHDVKCWGANAYGQLGYGDTTARSANGDNLDVVDLGDFDTIKLGDGGGSIQCAISGDGKVKCWGFSKYCGQEGVGGNIGDEPNEMGDHLNPIDYGADFFVVEVGCAVRQCCALTVDGKVKCWGTNAYGMLGYGDTTERGTTANTMGDFLPIVDFGTGFVVENIAVGHHTNCVISTEGEVKCFGLGSLAGLGLSSGATENVGVGPNEMGDYLSAVDVGSGFSLTEIQLMKVGGMNYHFCVHDNQPDHLRCWGWNLHGQLGYGDTDNRGDDANDMGDNLPLVAFGDWPIVPTPEPVCDAVDMVNVNWHDMLNENASPSLKHSEEIKFEASSLSLVFSASLEYIGKSADGNFDDEFNLGTTYWIDFESFSSGADNIRSPGSCGNRRSADFSGPDFADLWTFPVNPADLGSASTAARMAYPPSDWTLNANDCTTIKYERTLSWADLTSCQDAAGNALISVENTNEALKLSGTFFVELISPYLMSTEGYFRTFPLVQRDFEIVLNKQVDVLSSTGTQLFITSVMAYGREDDGTYLVTVLIQSADYVRFDLDDAAAVTAPSGITVSAVDSFVGDCLVSSSFTCGQIFTAKIAASCSDDDSVDLSGSYQFAFTPQCIVLEDGSTDPTCEAFKTTLDAAGKVALGVDASFVDQCDVDLFAVSFNGTLSFYSDDQFAVAVDANSDPFVIGQDTIFGKVTVSMTNPAITYTLSGVTIERVYVCTAANALPDISGNGAGGCLSGGIDDGPYNVIGDGADPEYQGTIITSTELDEGRFSFLTFDTARDTIYVHVQALLDVTFATGRRRRVRMLLQSERAEEGEANQFRSFVGTASVQQDEDTEDDDVETDGAAGCSFSFVAAMIVFTAWFWG